MVADLLIYGSYGYAGSLIARNAAEDDLDPILAGRRAEGVETQATELGCDHRVFSLEHPGVVENRIEDVAAVLNCAGPFSETAEPLVRACLRTETDYLDIAGEIDVLEATVEHDRDAENADVTLLPAVGFDAVPTDCLAISLDDWMDDATDLTIAIDGLGTFSPGTVKSIIDGMDRPGAIREAGVIRTVPVAWRTRGIDFGQGARTAMTVPWGEVSTGYYTTGIPNIETYATVPDWAVSLARRGRAATALLRPTPVRRALSAVVDVAVSGPTAEERAQSTTRIWAAATNDDSARVSARLRTPDTYDVTAMIAVEAARRTLEGEVHAGFQTPGLAFGADFITSFDGVERETQDVIEA